MIAAPKKDRAILPFVRPEPEPFLRTWRTFIVQGVAYRVVGERWHAEDIHRLDFPCLIDPGRPGEALSFRMIDLDTGEFIAPVSDEELDAFLAPQCPEMGA